jgi:hypothetical protein
MFALDEVVLWGRSLGMSRAGLVMDALQDRAAGTVHPC